MSFDVHVPIAERWEVILPNCVGCIAAFAQMRGSTRSPLYQSASSFIRYSNVPSGFFFITGIFFSIACTDDVIKHTRKNNREYFFILKKMM